MGVSAAEPISQAIDRTIRMLFKPFSAGKWFTLGFCAWLAHLAEGGGGNNVQLPGGGGGGGPPAPPGPGVPGVPGVPGPGGSPLPPSPAEEFEEIKQTLLDNAYWIFPIVLLAIAIWVALSWVRARGKFLFLEGVAYDRAEVVEPWKRLAKPANAYFRFELLLTVLMVVSLILLGAAALALAMPDIRAERLTGTGIAAIVVGGLGLIVWALGFGLASAVAEDFLIPLMYLRGGTVGTAWREFRTALLPRNVGSFILFYLLRIVLGIGMALIVFVGTCVTCCVAGLPYLNAVFFLPLFVFFRAYPLYFLRQFGPQYNVVAELPPPTMGAFPVIIQAPPPPPDGGQWPTTPS